MGNTIEQAARVIRDAIGHFRASESMAEAAAQALSDAGLLASGEPVAWRIRFMQDGHPMSGWMLTDGHPQTYVHRPDDYEFQALVPLPTPPEGKQP